MGELKKRMEKIESYKRMHAAHNEALSISEKIGIIKGLKMAEDIVKGNSDPFYTERAVYIIKAKREQLEKG